MVKDLEDSLKFYQEVVGLKVIRRLKAGPETEIAFLGNDEPNIELICDESHQNINVGTDISWGFETDSLEKTIKLVKERGYQVLGEPIQPAPNLRFFFALDPNGMMIQFVEYL